MYPKLELTKDVSIQHPIAAYKLHTVYFATHLIGRPIAAYKLHTVYFATDLIGHPKGREKVNAVTQQ